MSFFNRLNEALFKKPERFIRRKVSKRLMNDLLMQIVAGNTEINVQTVFYKLVKDGHLTDGFPDAQKLLTKEFIAEMPLDDIKQILSDLTAEKLK